MIPDWFKDHLISQFEYLLRETDPQRIEGGLAAMITNLLMQFAVTGDGETHRQAAFLAVTLSVNYNLEMRCHDATDDKEREQFPN